MTYHPNHNPADLPTITCVEDLDRLPWGGNHWWDWPIMQHVDKVVVAEGLPVETRMAIAARAGKLMTGEDCGFAEGEAGKIEFNDYLRHAAGAK